MTHPIEIDDDTEAEQYEEIPWSHLVEELGRPRYNVPLIVAGVLVIGALVGFLIARVLTGGAPVGSIETTIEPTVASTLAPAPTAPPVGVSPPLAPPTTPPPADVLFSEADLMAVASDVEIGTVAARAEWFVREYFTIDGSGGPSAQVQQVVDGSGVARPDATTYVEWTRSQTVEPLAPGRYGVTVLFGMLVADGERFMRQPVRAVTVTVDIDETLAAAVTGLPRPAPVTTRDAVLSAGEERLPPEGVLAVATEHAHEFGTEPRLLRSWLADGTWHIVLSVQHGGAAWPLLVDVPEPGSPP